MKISNPVLRSNLKGLRPVLSFNSAVIRSAERNLHAVETVGCR